MMNTDRELLELAAMAISEYEAWKERNSTRRALRDWLRKYAKETGEFFDDALSLPEDIDAHTELSKSAKAAQRLLISRRAATRRAIARAAAEIGRNMP